MDALKSLVQPLVGGGGGSSVIDGVKLVVLGTTVETARRAASAGWSHFVNSFFLTAHFSEEDYPYDWLMLWLSRRPEWQRSREFETTTRTSSAFYNSTTSRAADNSFGDDDDEEVDDEDCPGKVKTRVVFQPTFDTSHTIYYRGHWLRVKRSRAAGSGCEVLSISVVARNNSILKQLVLQAKREYEAEAVHRIQIYFADSHGSWRWTDSRHKRPMSSIVLNPGVKEMLMSDTRDFLKSEKWYADRGIPFRRGYLLYGVPGSGKSSLIHAIAGELMLDIYVVSLSSSWINDSTLTTLMGRVPARCIVLLEDLDAAFTRSVTRDNSSNGTPNADKSGNSSGEEYGPNDNSSGRRRKEQLSDVNTLTLSGLLNALDGVAAAEGRLLFATTNHLERLDPALSRPGRMDVWIEFKNASKWQAELLFRNFFPSAEDEAIVEEEGDLDGIELPNPPSPAPSSMFSLPSFASSSTSLISTPSSTPTKASSSSSGSRRSRNGSVAPSDGASTPLPQGPAYLPPPVEESLANYQHSAVPLSNAKLAELGKKFADSIPDEEFSVAALQGYLLKNKSRPEAAANDASAWVISERELREKLKREREARELKEKLEKEKKREELEKEKKKKEAEEKKEEEKKKAEEKKAEETSKKIPASPTPPPETPKPEVKALVTEESDGEENKENEEEPNSPDGASTPADGSSTWVRVVEPSS